MSNWGKDENENCGSGNIDEVVEKDLNITDVSRLDAETTLVNEPLSSYTLIKFIAVYTSPLDLEKPNN
jgi:hypothetical protein